MYRKYKKRGQKPLNTIDENRSIKIPYQLFLQRRALPYDHSAHIEQPFALSQDPRQAAPAHSRVHNKWRLSRHALTESSIMNSAESLALFYEELATVISQRCPISSYWNDRGFTMWLCELMTFRFQQSFATENTPKPIKANFPLLFRGLCEVLIHSLNAELSGNKERRSPEAVGVNGGLAEWIAQYSAACGAAP
ncbi:GL27127 [Drosophila persimilis]|uniref:GL27127 n=1 Tax=Drosophila persimilis TaxID=7234 RepID=B4GZF4_DROPE|nr:GL27127 [Drosophila persimilis]